MKDHYILGITAFIGMMLSACTCRGIIEISSKPSRLGADSESVSNDLSPDGVNGVTIGKQEDD